MTNPSPHGDAFLVCHGSFNPVHWHHVEIMVKARAKLEASGYRVIAGVLAPCNRGHLLWKGGGAISDEHRLAALKLACEDAAGPAGWLRCDARGMRFGSGSGMIRRLLAAEFRSEASWPTGFDVKGADVVVRYDSYWYELRYPCIIIGRAGWTEAIQKGFEGTGMRVPPECIVLEEELPGDVSSTRLRAALAAGDKALVQSLCPGRAGEYLLEMCSRLYEAPDREPGAEADAAGEEGSSAKRQRPCLPEVAQDVQRPLGAASMPEGPAPLRVYFIRHGEARHNVDPEAWKERDPPLTARGEAQASQLRHHPLLVGLRRPLIVVVSPLRRTLQTATLGFTGQEEAAGPCRFVANSDLQETTFYPCDLGRPQSDLAGEFAEVDFSGLDGEAWVEKEAPKHHDRWVRLQRFAGWCAAHPAEELVAVTHQGVCQLLFGVLLDNCDVLGVSLQRATLRWEPLTYRITPEHMETLRWTATKGSAKGIRFLLAGPGGGAPPGVEVGEGWPMLHFAAGGGNASATRELLRYRADPAQLGSCGLTARDWAEKEGWAETVQAFAAAEADGRTAGS